MVFRSKQKNNSEKPRSVWARPGMQVTFRAEIMPGRSREERTFQIKTVRSNGRVLLEGFPEEHREGAFEPLNFQKNIKK